MQPIMLIGWLEVLHDAEHVAPPPMARQECEVGCLYRHIGGQQVWTCAQLKFAWHDMSNVTTCLHPACQQRQEDDMQPSIHVSHYHHGTVSTPCNLEFAGQAHIHATGSTGLKPLFLMAKARLSRFVVCLPNLLERKHDGQSVHSIMIIVYHSHHFYLPTKSIDNQNDQIFSRHMLIEFVAAGMARIPLMMYEFFAKLLPGWCLHLFYEVPDRRGNALLLVDWGTRLCREPQSRASGCAMLSCLLPRLSRCDTQQARGERIEHNNPISMLASWPDFCCPAVTNFSRRRSAGVTKQEGFNLKEWQLSIPAVHLAFS